MPRRIIEIPSDRILGINITAETFIRGLVFNFPTFPKGKEYPIVVNVNNNSIAYKKGLRIGHKLIKLNGYSFYCKDISTILCDFNYEKKSNSVLKIMYE